MKNHLDSCKNNENEFQPSKNTHFQKMLYFSNNDEKLLSQASQVKK